MKICKILEKPLINNTKVEFEHNFVGHEWGGRLIHCVVCMCRCGRGGRGRGEAPHNIRGDPLGAVWPGTDLQHSRAHAQRLPVQLVQLEWTGQCCAVLHM